MYRNLGLDLAGCAKLLHVTERTLHNWASGKHDIPYATYRLLRLLNHMELPGASWDGWCFHGGRLWSPEGRSFVGTDGSWWSLLVRQASMFGVMCSRLQAVEGARRGPACGEVPGAFGGLGGRDSAVTRHFSPAGRKNRLANVEGHEVPVTPQASLTGETEPRSDRAANSDLQEAA